ncbi:exonuclease SbcCD subunit D [Haloimpatiens sp. FM7315]|uniref:exonuclease SbcCD subunit D n=1 Tax=Haloimpatiens sp. FM7315 TaxID=3298609 RepID=UPI00370B6086
MKLIHTSDWHLGKMLEGNSRLDEQEQFIDEFTKIVDEENADMVVIAGDIYDSSNPQAKAERLFYKALKALSSNGKRVIVVISGNHDNPDRLEAASPILYEQGIIILGTPRSVAKVGKCGEASIIKSGEGYFEIDIKGERAIVLALPYPSEKRLNEIISDELSEEERQKDYSEKIGDIFLKLSENFREDSINLAVSHLFTLGGESSDSERPIQLGGSLTVNSKKLPLEASYIALGHLHKPQKVKGTNGKARYSGAPIQYSKSERGNVNCVYSVEMSPFEEAKIKEIYLRNYKPIELWKSHSIEDAIKKCKENQDKNCWVYLEVSTDRVILQEEIKEMKKYKKDIVEIRPILKENSEDEVNYENLAEKSIDKVFIEFYKHERNIEPEKEILDLFLKIANGEEGENNETNTSQN